MKIRHKKWGDIDGVQIWNAHGPSCNAMVIEEWEKNGAVYRRKDGWEEALETRLVDVTGECFVEPPESPYTSCAGKVATPTNWLRTPVPHLGGIGLGHGYKWGMVDRYDLPDQEALIARFDEYLPLSIMECCQVTEYLRQFKKPCLIIQKEEPCP